MPPLADATYRKLAIWKASIGTMLCAAGVLPSLILNWDTMTAAGRLVGVLGMIVAIGKFLDGFFDQTFARVALGKPPVQLPGFNGVGELHQETTTITDVKKTGDTSTITKPNL